LDAFTARPHQLLYAVPIGEDKLPEVLVLQRDNGGAQLHVFVDTLTAAEYTNKAAAAAGRRQTVFLKIDCGYGYGTKDDTDGTGSGMVPDRPIQDGRGLTAGFHRRAGVPVHDAASVALAKTIAALPALELLGIYCHAGHSYDCCGVEEVRRLHGSTTGAQPRAHMGTSRRAYSAP